MNKEKIGCKECNFYGFVLIEDHNQHLKIVHCDACTTFENDDDAVDFCFNVASEFQAGRLMIDKILNNT